MALGPAAGALAPAARVLAALLLAVSGASAQTTVVGVAFVADLADGREARVTVEATLAGPALSDSVEVSLLDFGVAVPFDLRVGRPGTPVELRRLRGAARGGRVPVERDGEGGGMLRAAYRVPLAPAPDGGVTVHLPVLVVELPLAEARAGLFRSRVTVPEGWVVTEGFPTALVALAETGAVEADLQVVPSVVTLRARTDGAWRPGLPLLLDGVAVAGLLLFAVAGWRHLGSPA